MALLAAFLIVTTPWTPAPALEDEDIPEEVLSPPAHGPRYGPTVRGRATYYGFPGTFNGRPTSCGTTYWSSSLSLIAVPHSRAAQWPCGTVLQVSGPAGTIVGTRQDTCPGCDRAGVLLDLADAAHTAVCGRGTCTVTVQQVFTE
jgi:hypothetical protein